LLTDDEVFKLKGGNSGFLLKCLVGFGAVFAYLTLSKRIAELRRFEISGGTFFKSNLIFFGTIAAWQKFKDVSSGNEMRLRMHKSALFNRAMFNLGFVKDNKKKPKFH
jgi:hypothetical protein